MANPDPQTMIDNLTATYTTLSTEVSISRSAFGRGQTLQRMKDIREEIDYWEKRRDQVARAGRTFVQGRPVR